MATPRLTRAQWGAVPVDPDRPTRVPSTAGTAQHWVGPRVWGDAGPAGRHSLCAGKLRGIQRAHMAGEYYDVAYNEAACPHGYRYELRGHHVQTGANGSSAGNRSHYAILALVGEGDPTTPELLEALADAHEDYRAHAAAGDDTTTHAAILEKHTGRTTGCPGPGLIREESAGTFTQPSQEEPMPTAAEIATEVWTRPVRDHEGNEVTTGAAVGVTLRNSAAATFAARDAARDAAVARALAEAAATTPGVLTAEDVAAVAAATVAAVDANLDARDRALAEALAAAGEVPA